MNRTQFLILVVVLIVLGGAAAAILRSERGAWQSGNVRIGEKVVPSLTISDVAQVLIHDGSGEVHLAREPLGWVVRERADFPADVERIGALLLKAAELKVVQAERLPESQRKRLELVDPSAKAAAGAGTLLELRDAKGAVLAHLLLGKKVQGGGAGSSTTTGRYLESAADAGTMIAVSEPFAEVQARPEQWIAKNLIRAERLKSIASFDAAGKQGWRLERDGDTADWRFADSKQKPDAGKVQDIASSLAYMNLVDVVPAAKKAETGLDHAPMLKADTFDGLTYTVRIGNPAGDNYYVGVAVTGEPPAPAKEEKAGGEPAKAGQDAGAAKTAGKDGKDESKTKAGSEKDGKAKAAEDRHKKLVERLVYERKLDRWNYLVVKSSVEPMLRDRAQLLPEKPKK